MMKSNLKFWVHIIISLYRVSLEKGSTVSVYGHLQNMMEAVSWFAAAFQPIVLGSFKN